MEGGLIPFDSVLRLITPMKLGYFELTDISGANTLAKSHLNDDDADLDTNTIIDILQTYMQDLGKGNYKVHLRNKHKANIKTGLTYKFFYSDHLPTNYSQQQAQPLQTQPQAFAGLGYTEIESIREKAKLEARSELGALHAMEIRQLEFQHKMENQLKEAKAKNTGNEPPAWLAGVLEPVKMLGAVLAAKIAPEAMPIINAMIIGENNEAETEETETVNTVVRTD